MSETLEFKYQEAKDFPASAYVCSLEDWLKLHNKIQNVIKCLKELPRLVLEDERNNPAWSETDLLEALKKCAAVIGEPQEGHWATDDEVNDAYDSAVAAIAKAKGEQP